MSVGELPSGAASRRAAGCFRSGSFSASGTWEVTQSRIPRWQASVEQLSVLSHSTKCAGISEGERGKLLAEVIYAFEPSWHVDLIGQRDSGC